LAHEIEPFSALLDSPQIFVCEGRVHV
jgi:hypothetical protein